MTDHPITQGYLAEKTLDYVAHISRVQRPANADDDLTYIPARALMIGAVIDLHPVMEELAHKLGDLGMTEDNPIINNEALAIALETTEAEFMHVTGIRLAGHTNGNIDDTYVVIDVSNLNVPTVYVPSNTLIGVQTSPYDEV
jgi:hypothetical protein